MKGIIEIIDYNKFIEISQKDEKLNELTFGNGSSLESINERSKDSVDNRDIEIDNILSDQYVINLDISDIDQFINLVENDKFIKCDLNDYSNTLILNAVLERKENIKYTYEYILNNIEGDFKFLNLSTLSKLPHNLFTEYPDKFDWEKISYLSLSENFIEENIDNINFSNLDYTDVSVSFLVKYSNKLTIPEFVFNSLPIMVRREIELNKILT